MMQKTESGVEGRTSGGGWFCMSKYNVRKCIIFPPKQQAVVFFSYTTLSLTMNHHIPYIPQAVHSATSLTIFFNPPEFINPPVVWCLVLCRVWCVCVGLSPVVTVMAGRSDGFMVHDVLIMAH